MGKLVIDVTQLVNWTGRLTGVPRVMDELSVRFAQEYEGCVFVEWDGVRQEFYQFILFGAFASPLELLRLQETLNSSQALVG